MIFESDRLRLVEFSEQQLDARVMSWFNNDELMRYYTNSKRKIDKEELLESIEKSQSDRTAFTYFIEHKESVQLIGTLKVGPINRAHKIADLVTLIGERGGFGKGLGTEAIALGVRLAFEKYDLRKLFGGMYANNIASIKAYTRAGWIVEGVLKGHYWEDEKNHDRILVGCFNPKYFTDEEIEKAKYANWYENN